MIVKRQRCKPEVVWAAETSEKCICVLLSNFWRVDFFVPYASYVIIDIIFGSCGLQPLARKRRRRLP